MELVIRIWWVCHSAGRAGLLLLKEGEWEGKETPEHIWKARATDERQVSWPVSSLGRAEDHCPLGRFSSSPSYSDSPGISSSSTGCKSNSGRHKGKGGTGIILMFWIGHLPWQHPLGPVPRGSCTQPLVLTAVSIFCLQTTQNPFLMNFFSCKSHLNDIWLSKQSIQQDLYISPHSYVCFSCFGMWH